MAVSETFDASFNLMSAHAVCTYPVIVRVTFYKVLLH